LWFYVVVVFFLVGYAGVEMCFPDEVEDEHSEVVGSG
jgi:hypothetical protein